jgi:cephalosporin-C deacetylase
MIHSATGFVCASLLIMLTCARSNAEESIVKGLFRDTSQGLVFFGDRWSIRSEPDRGWSSLKVEDSEFLHSIVFDASGKRVANFPDRSTLSHDSSNARFGMVGDGVYMIRVTPDNDRRGFALYVGYNIKLDQKCVMFLGDDVVLARVGSGANRSESWSVAKGKVGQGQSVPGGAVLVHRSGRALILSEPAWVGTLADEKQTPRLAVVFNIKGFAANEFRFRVDPEQRTENFVSRPSFNVVSSDDPAQKTMGATNGVCNPVYTPATQLDFGVEFQMLDNRTFTGSVEVQIDHALGKRQFAGSVPLKNVSPDSAGRIIAKFKPTFTDPGVHEVSARLLDDQGNLIWTSRYRAAWDLENYKPSIITPSDFATFWRSTLDELRSKPLDATTTRVKQFEDHPTHELYEVSFIGYRGQRLYALLYVPKGVKAPMPAMVTAHPGITGFNLNKRPDGVYGSKINFDPRFVVIVPLIRGHKPDAADIPFNNPWWGPLDNRDDYVARSWYCAMVRAIDYLATRPELVDIKRVVSKGGSQGGALALVTAALDERVVVCLADCPSNCQPQEIMLNYSSFGPSRGQVPAGRTFDDTVALLSYYNPVNFCPLIKCPTYVGSNIGDLTVHSMGPIAAYKNLTALTAENKAFYPGFTHFHGSGPGLGEQTRKVLDALAGESKPSKD